MCGRPARRSRRSSAITPEGKLHGARDPREPGAGQPKRRVVPGAPQRIHRSARPRSGTAARIRTVLGYAGHTSEIPQPGDFPTRRVAGRSLILVRSADGVVRVLLNTCTHRGAQVYRESCGNTKTFQCFYHAWTFDTDGRLVGVPGEDAYSAAFDREELRLGREPALADPDQQRAHPGGGRGHHTCHREFCRLSHARRAGRHVCRSVRVHAGARDGALRIQRRRAILDLETLRLQGKVSILLLGEL